MSDKLSTNAVARLLAYSPEWVRKNIPSEQLDTGCGKRTIRIYDRATVEEFIQQKEAKKINATTKQLKNAA